MYCTLSFCIFTTQDKIIIFASRLQNCSHYKSKMYKLASLVNTFSSFFKLSTLFQIFRSNYSKKLWMKNISADTTVLHFFFSRWKKIVKSIAVSNKVFRVPTERPKNNFPRNSTFYARFWAFFEVSFHRCRFFSFWVSLYSLKCLGEVWRDVYKKNDFWHVSWVSITLRTKLLKWDRIYFPLGRSSRPLDLVIREKTSSSKWKKRLMFFSASSSFPFDVRVFKKTRVSAHIRHDSIVKCTRAWIDHQR